MLDIAKIIAGGDEGFGPHVPEQEFSLGPYKFKEAAALSQANEQLYKAHNPDTLQTQVLVNANGGLKFVLQNTTAMHVIVGRVYGRGGLGKTPGQR